MVFRDVSVDQGRTGFKIQREPAEFPSVEDRIWAPWRAQYIREGAKAPAKSNACFLCQALGESDDRANLLAWRGTHSIVMLNRYPYNNGHLLVAPRRHAGTLEAFSGPELTEPIETVRRMIANS